MATVSEPKIFNHPRPKKALLPPRSKKRQTDHKIDEIAFDFDARADYLTGFHKRKVQRAERAKAEAEKRAREEKIVMRKQVGSYQPNVQVWALAGRIRDAALGVG